jgi:predicted amidohydrolase
VRIAISGIKQIVGNDQHRMDNRISDGVRTALNTVTKQIYECGKNDVSLVCFPQWFIGFGSVIEYPNEITEAISVAAKNNKLDVVTGTFRTPGFGMKSKPVSLFINHEGKIVGEQGKKNLYELEEQWQLSSNDVNVFESQLGKIVISHGDDCVDPNVYEQIKKIKPNIWVLQTNDAINTGKFEACSLSFEELAKLRSRELECTICAPMLNGEFMHVNYSGDGFICDSLGKTIKISGSKELLLYR